MTANIKPLLLNSLPDSFLLSGIFRKRRLQQSLLPPYRNPLLKSSLLSSLRNFLNDDIALHIQGSYGSLIYHSHHHLIHTRRYEKRILPVKFQKVEVKKAQNAKKAKRILPVNFQNNNKLKKNIAKKGNRTLDLHFTRVSLYQLSYFGADLE